MIFVSDKAHQAISKSFKNNKAMKPIRVYLADGG